MIIQLPRTSGGGPKKVDIKMDDFSGGVNRLVESTRLKPTEAREALNLMLVQDGVWKPRWGTDYYTPAISGVTGIDGFGEYVPESGDNELVMVGNDGKIYKSVDGGTPSELTTSGSASAGMTAGNQCYFQQIKSELYIANGVDDLVRYDGTNIATYNNLSAPTWAATPIARGAGLTSGSYSYFYQITALNEVGETVGSTEETINVNIERDSWSAADEYLDIDWQAVANATRYQIYMSDEAGYCVLLDGVSADVTAYKDTGSAVANPYIEVPDDNTTAAPKFKHMAMSNNRMWATGNPNSKFRVYFSGTGQFIGFFSDYYGGGWIDLEKGGRDEPVAMVHYQDGSGSGIATAVCKTPEGRGAIWQLSITTATVEDETFAVPSAVKVVGSVGSNAPLSVILADNDAWFVNNRGVFTLGPEKNFFGILRTNEVSAKIRPYWQDLVPSEIDNVAAYYYDSKVLFSVATAGSENNRIIYYDRERNAWVVEWTVGAKQFCEYTDSNGIPRLMFSSNGTGRISYFSTSVKGDYGSAFTTTYRSGRIPMSEDWTNFAKIKNAYIRLGNPEGSIELQILGTLKNSGFSAAASKTITSLFSMTGMGWDQMGDFQMGSTNGVPTSYAQASDIKYTKVNKKLRDLQFVVTTNDIQADYELLGFQADGFLIETKAPSEWKLD